MPPLIFSLASTVPFLYAATDLKAPHVYSTTTVYGDPQFVSAQNLSWVVALFLLVSLWEGCRP